MAKTFDQMQTVGFCAWLVAICLICWLLLLQPPPARGGPVTGTEYQVKAGFIYNFAKFATWPQETFDNSSNTLVLCFVSDDPDDDILYQLDGKTIKGRKLKVMAYQQGDCLEQSHILFFGTEDKDFIQQVLSQINNRSILTIGEVEGFTRMGGIISFFEEQNQLRFKVNIDAAERAKLKLSSQILVSAKIVSGENE